MLTLMAFLLGAAGIGYIHFPANAIGFGFPHLDSGLAVRPTFKRIAGFLSGRWIGYCFFGILFSWLGIFLNPLGIRLLLCGCILMAIFIYLFLITTHSPELSFAQMLDPSQWRFSTFLMGIFSVNTFTAPLLISIFMALLHPGIKNGIIFFSNVFLGNVFFLLPILLNMKWSRGKKFALVLKVVLFACATLLEIYSVMRLIKS